MFCPIAPLFSTVVIPAVVNPDKDRKPKHFACYVCNIHVITENSMNLGMMRNDVENTSGCFVASFVTGSLI